MRVFVTGASGHIGLPVVRELLAAGHKVVGLARSDTSAKLITEAGAEARLGDLDNLEGLKEAVRAADGVIHLAFNHDFSKLAENSESDKRAIEALGEALDGSSRPLLVTPAVGLAQGRAAT